MARLVEFAGYEMPVWYTSTVDEHMAVRNDAESSTSPHGQGKCKRPRRGRFIEASPTDIGKLPNGKSVYTLLLNKDAGIIDT